MKKVYYAHCIAIYNTPQERRDVATLEGLGFTVVNPNSPACAAGYKEHGMDYFKEFATTCDFIAFRSLPNGSIPAGVAAEIAMFKNVGKPVIELPSAVGLRALNADQTREYLMEVGYR